MCAQGTSGLLRDAWLGSASFLFLIFKRIALHLQILFLA